MDIYEGDDRADLLYHHWDCICIFNKLKRGLPLAENPRVKKGLKRGVQPIGIGYLIQLGIPALMSFRWYDSFWEIDVLHCIGLALISLIGLYVLCDRLRLPLPLIFIGVGTHPSFGRAYHKKLLTGHFFLASLSIILPKREGSNFTPIPWVGYTLIGGVIGWHVSRDQSLYRTPWWPAFFLILGWLLMEYKLATIDRDIQEYRMDRVSASGIQQLPTHPFGACVHGDFIFMARVGVRCFL